MLAAISGMAVAVAKIPLKAVKRWWGGSRLKEENIRLKVSLGEAGKNMFSLFSSGYECEILTH